MSRISRREFAKLAGAAALVAPLAVTARDEPLAPGMVWPQEAPKKPEAPAPAQPAQQPEAPKLKLSKEQEEAVKKAVERRDRQLAAMRSRSLPYDAEPAFVFSVRRRPRQPKL
jgi:hypothetical protein